MEKKETKNKDMEMFGDSDLPEDIIVYKILVRLPVVDVMRCTSVCKRWYFLLQAPCFVSAHISQPSIFIHHYSPTRESQILSNYDPQSFNDRRRRTVPFPSTLPNRKIIVGHIRGVFCLFSGPISDQHYCLWNPSVRRYVPLPSPSNSSSLNFNRRRPKIVRGFGFDDKSSDYKVVLLVYLWGEDGLSYTPNCLLFSLKQGSWRTVLGAVEEAKNCDAVDGGIFLNGALHWPAKSRRREDRSRPFVLAFDIARETFREIELPRQLLDGSHKHSILEIKGSLACFDFEVPHLTQELPQPQRSNINCYSIWVMKDYGIPSSWVKMWTLELTSTLLWVYGFWGAGDEILMRKEDCFGVKDLFLYDIKTQRTRDIGGDVVLDFLNFYACNESLILLDKESGAVSYDEPGPDANLPLRSTYTKRKRWSNF